MIRESEAVIVAREACRLGKIRADKANVYIVQLMGVRIVGGIIPLAVRRELNAAVKNGEIGHIKKEGLKPEAYYHKNARADALAVRNRIEREARQALMIVCGARIDDPIA